MKEMICPYCFEKFREPIYLCSEKSIRHLRYDERKVTIQSVVDKGNGITETVQMDYYQPIRVKKNKDNKYVCKECGKSVFLKCPKCNKTLPQTNSTILAALCGIVGSGKTYYISTVIDKLKISLNMLEIGFSFTSAEDGRQYEKLKNMLWKDRLGPSHIEKTGKGDDNFTEPILYNVHSKTIDTISFVDKAGEIFLDEYLLSYHAPYLVNSSMLLIIMDPLNIEYVRDTMIRENIPFAGYKSVNSTKRELNDAILTRINNVYRQQAGMGDKGQIETPVVIAFSKWDYIEKCAALKPEHFTLSENDVIVNGKFSEQAFLNNSAVIEKFLNDCGECELNFRLILKKYFKNVYYCAFSAYGTETYINENGIEEKPKLTPKSAKHVEDPFLWLLSKKKIIK